MRLVVDLTTNIATITPTPAKVKRGDDLALEIQFRRNGQPELLPDGSTIEFSAKLAGQPGTGFVMHGGTFAAPNSPSGYYTGYVSANTQQLSDALGISDSNVNGTPSVKLDAELSWVAGGHPASSQTIALTAENDVNRGDEGDPTDADPAYPAANTIELLSRKNANNGYCGLDAGGKVPEARLKRIPHCSFLASVGDTNEFKAFPTTGLSNADTVCFWDVDGGGALVVYTFDRTSAEPTADDGDYPTWVRADDWHTSTNPGAWRLLQFYYLPGGAGDAGDLTLGGYLNTRGIVLNGYPIYTVGGRIGDNFVSGSISSIGAGIRRFRFTGSGATTATFVAIADDATIDTSKFHIGCEVLVINAGTAALTLRASDASTLVVLQPGESVLAVAEGAAVTWRILPIVAKRRDGGTALNANTSGATNIDGRLGSAFQFTLTGGATLTPANVADGQRIPVLVKQDGTGGRSLAWSGVTWPGGVTPSQTSTAGKADLYELVSINGTVYGRQLATNL